MYEPGRELAGTAVRKVTNELSQAERERKMSDKSSSPDSSSSLNNNNN